MTPRDRLRQILQDDAVQYGDFVLASGRRSTYKVIANKALFSSEALSLCGDLLADAVGDVDAVGGPETGAIVMAAAVLTACHRRGRPMRGFFVRKEPKPNGGGLLAGELMRGDRVAILEDVITSGGSVLKAIQAIEQAGATVARIVCICDRIEGGAAALAAYPFTALYTIRDFGIEPPAEFR